MGEKYLTQKVDDNMSMNYNTTHSGSSHMLGSERLNQKNSIENSPAGILLASQDKNVCILSKTNGHSTMLQRIHVHQ